MTTWYSHSLFQIMFTQSEFDIRLEWGEHGVNLLAPVSDVVIIVDVLSFTTSVEIATHRRATVFPFDAEIMGVTPTEFAGSVEAQVAGKERKARFSLSPVALSKIPEGTRLVLPSPNGSRLSLRTGRTPTLAGCLRNAEAVAKAAQRYGRRITLIPAGERWPDDSLRPSLEDWIGAGAIIHHLGGNTSPEARAAASVFDSVYNHLEDTLVQCGSGKELVEQGFQEDVRLASVLNLSDCVPVLTGGAFIAQRGA